MMRFVYPTDQQWAAELTGNLPGKWRRRLLNQWGRAHRGEWTPHNNAGRVAANVALRETVSSLGVVRIPLDATDSEICNRADTLAARCFEQGQIFHGLPELREAMGRIAVGNGAAPPQGKKITDAGAVARMTDALWWRRQLRKVHAKNVEGAAIRLGYVNRARQCYVSDESLRRRTQQNARNLDMLEATTATNENGQEYTLAELAAKGPANKAVRRAELMTRIAGFERIAIDMGHAGLFLTMTCPSYMHKWRTVKGGGVIENPRYQGTTPSEAQSYLAKVWARIRAALHRAKVGIYGFRISEPNHDGTPHWHLLVFHAQEHFEMLKATILKHALKDAPMEPGATRHRVDFKPMEAGKGTAAGYIAKYVAKNIDGYKLGADLYGNPALETSARVEAWATTSCIRQFQQIGGAPVGPWRELRRVKELPANAPDHLAKAWRAVNKLAIIEGKENASVAWDHYTQAQGGVFCGRGYRVRVATKQVDDLGRYGEPIGARPIGVETTTRELWTPEWMAHMGGRSERTVLWVVPSQRYTWTIKQKNGAGRGVQKRGCAAPWTRVNNCTQEEQNEPEQRAGEPGRGHAEGHPGMEWSANPYQTDGGGLCGAAVGHHAGDCGKAGEHGGGGAW